MNKARNLDYRDSVSVMAKYIIVGYTSVGLIAFVLSAFMSIMSGEPVMIDGNNYSIIAGVPLLFLLSLSLVIGMTIVHVTSVWVGLICHSAVIGVLGSVRLNKKVKSGNDTGQDHASWLDISPSFALKMNLIGFLWCLGLIGLLGVFLDVSGVVPSHVFGTRIYDFLDALSLVASCLSGGLAMAILTWVHTLLGVWIYKLYKKVLDRFI